MKKALVQSVGTGTRPDVDITKPLVWHCRKSGADIVAWVVSEDSRSNADRMARELNLSAEQFEIRQVTAFEDVECVYRESRRLLRDLESRGFAPEQIEVDYTSGTKAMTAGLVLAAVAHRCGTLLYIAGERRAGVVIEGTERPVPVEPRRVWADESIHLAMEHCKAFRFDTALTVLDMIKDEWLDDHGTQLKAGLTAVANGYGAWDRFEYGRACGELHKVLKTEVHELLPFMPDNDLPSRLMALKPEQGISADRLADLFNNAARRLAEGRYDDALARLYRVAEMLAQWILLKEYAISTADVDPAKVPADLRVRIETHRNEEGKIQIGLDWDYRLLKALNHPVGADFGEGVSRGIGVLLKRRNDSLLAHGFEPIAKKDVLSLMEKLGVLVRMEVSDFSERRMALEFPWRRGKA